MSDVCCLKGCDEPHFCLGFCSRHYDRIRPMDHPFRDRKSKAAGFGLSNKERFDLWVEKTDGGCWIWKGQPDARGYGVFSLVKDGIKGSRRRYIRAHRWSWEDANGRQIPQGMLVRHLCNCKLCVNPDHLEIGTHEENIQDSIDGGLYPRGTGHPMSKVNDDIVRDIRTSKESAVEIARRYRISVPLVYKIRSRAGWKHVT